MNRTQTDDNVTLERALRRANLLTAAAEVSQNITHIMDIGVLLPKTVDIICNAYNFYYAGVFLIDEAGDFAVLRAGRGEPGRIMIENNHKLAVGGNSMIGACTAHNEARISLDVDTEKVWYPNPVLPETRSEMALPLAISGRVIGAVTVQSVEAAAFSDEDISSLQAMANQLAIAIENARQRHQLEQAHAELVQAKTFQAIATATGDAIHWIGNKAEPIGESTERVRHDVRLLVAAAADLLDDDSPSNIGALIKKEAAAVRQSDPDIETNLARLQALPLDKLQKHLSLNSILDDLDIINNAAALIMQVKEELIGPAREQAPRPTMADDVINDTVNQMNLPPGLIVINTLGDLPLVMADPVQLNRVFVNLIKNAVEATTNQDRPNISLTLHPTDTGQTVNVTITDNGVGIAPDDLDEIWITFHSTKGIKHSGLGLSACRLILQQMGGSISVESELNKGTSFTVSLPAASPHGTSEASTIKGRGSLLLIDDDDHWRYFAAKILTAAGFKVKLLAPTQAVDKANKYDLILLDDILQNADSGQLLHTLKRAGVIAKVLVVSSNPRVERTKERLLLGIRDLVPKPYTSQGLLTQVANVLT